MKLRVDLAQSFFYPDVVVTCNAADLGEATANQHPNWVTARHGHKR